VTSELGNFKNEGSSLTSINNWFITTIQDMVIGWLKVKIFILQSCEYEYKNVL